MCYVSDKRIINKGGNPRYEPVGRGTTEYIKMTNVCKGLIHKFSKNIENYTKNKEKQ